MISNPLISAALLGTFGAAILLILGVIVLMGFCIGFLYMINHSINRKQKRTPKQLDEPLVVVRQYY